VENSIITIGSRFTNNYSKRIGKMGDGYESQGLQHSQDHMYPDPSGHFLLPAKISIYTSRTRLNYKKCHLIISVSYPVSTRAQIHFQTESQKSKHTDITLY
jgi:hypothetical protein